MSEIADKLIDWYGVNGRDLPWRRTRDPYRIWLSEVILQQTRIAQGMDYYLRFVARFPDVGALAAADEDEVLKLWQGLGYYSRARNLHAAARQVVERYGGRFPAAYADVRSLKGVGDYTAAAVCSIAYDAPCAVVDGNVYRVLSRLFDLDLAIDTAEGRKAFAALADEQLDRRRPARYNQAIMDFGALQCTPANPSCNDCPLRDECLSLAAGTVAERPVKAGRTRIRPRYLNYLHLECGGRIALRRRPEGDIWQGLYDLPAIESDRPLVFGHTDRPHRPSATCSARFPTGWCGRSVCPNTSCRTRPSTRRITASRSTHGPPLPEGGRSCRTNSWRTMRSRACSTAISSGSATAIADPCAIPISVFSYGLPYESESPRL